MNEIEIEELTGFLNREDIKVIGGELYVERALLKRASNWRAYCRMEMNHRLPHFHVYSNEYECSMKPDGTVLAGDLPSNVMNKVLHWLRKDNGTEKVNEIWHKLNSIR